MNKECEDENQDSPVIVPRKNQRDICQHFIEQLVVIDNQSVAALEINLSTNIENCVDKVV